MTAAHRLCILVPTYDNPATVRSVVESVRAYVEHVVVVDDGSAEEGRRAVQALRDGSLAHVVRREKNGGKGAAVKTGLAAASELGFTHALQIDADGQHDVRDIPGFVEVSRAQPEALVLGAPVFDASAPKLRLFGRKITQFWTNTHTFGRVIQDPLCGFRVYPVAAAIAARVECDAMDFDPEIAVRLFWSGVPILNVPTRVRYVPSAEGGVSHFRMGADNLLIARMHTRMVFGALARLPARTGRWLIER
jgi:glycosyltransferase involved in cell wall biosynthesis